MVVILGWGSLVWDPRGLEQQLSGEWRGDGPMLPVEFCRQSKNGRLTLAIFDKAEPVQVLWSTTTTTDLAMAASALAQREDCPVRHITTLSELNPDSNPFGIRNWMQRIGAEATLWTGLPPKFQGNNFVAPTVSEAVDYLRSLGDTSRVLAEEYIRKAPRQIRTPYRAAIEEQLGWHPSEGTGK